VNAAIAKFDGINLLIAAEYSRLGFIVMTREASTKLDWLRAHVGRLTLRASARAHKRGEPR
jgi:hypothetical protein